MILRRATLLAIVLSAPAANAVFADQTLIPTPYPNAGTGALPLDPEPQGRRGPQELLRDPYPQILGDNAQGNPPIYKKHRHQKLVPSIYKRKYKVDR